MAAPRNPAPVSGPGALSRRTDGGPGSRQVQAEFSGGDYGDTTAMSNLQAAAPMEAAPTVAPVRSPAPADAAVPFNAPSQRPDEPMTAGSPFGPGNTPNPVPEAANEVRDNLEKFRPWLPQMRWAAAQDDASMMTRQFVAWVDAVLQ